MSKQPHDTSPALSLRGVTVALRARRSVYAESYPVLRGIDLDVFHGETLGVLGRNGAGKTTLLRVMAGVLKPDAGSVRRDAGASCQLLSLNPWLVPHLSGRQNALLSCMLNGVTSRRAKAMLPEIEKYADLGKYFDEPVSSYSSGMLVRLGFAAAIQVQPDILLLDELLGVGDADFYEKSTRSLKAQIDSDRTVVLVSHNEAALSELCHRIVWIGEGRVLAIGEPRDVLAQYRADLHPGGTDAPVPASSGAG